MSDPLKVVQSVHGHPIRIAATQRTHVVEAHDYMAGNLDLVVDTLSEPSRIIAGEGGESLALRDYQKTIISRKTAVVVYRDEPEGFLITAFLTSRPDMIEKKGALLWPR